MTKKLHTSGLQNISTLAAPDLIGEIGGVKVIADFKTSNSSLYELRFPDRGDRMLVSVASVNIKNVPNRWLHIVYALNERTGFLCEVALIIVSTPETNSRYIS